MHIYIYLYLFKRSVLQLRQKKLLLLTIKITTIQLISIYLLLCQLLFLKKIEFAKSRLLIILILTNLLTSLKKTKKS